MSAQLFQRIMRIFSILSGFALIIIVGWWYLKVDESIQWFPLFIGVGFCLLGIFGFRTTSSLPDADK